MTTFAQSKDNNSQQLQLQQPVAAAAAIMMIEGDEEEADNKSPLSNTAAADTAAGAGACQPNELPDNICFCTERKRNRQCQGKIHFIGAGEGDGTVGIERKRARRMEPNNHGNSNHYSSSSSQSCGGDGDLVGRIRESMRGLLHKKLENTDNLPPRPSSNNANAATDDEDSKCRLLETVETLLFTTACSLEEYASVTTLDQRLTKLLVALINRRLVRAGIYY